MKSSFTVFIYALFIFIIISLFSESVTSLTTTAVHLKSDT